MMLKKQIITSIFLVVLIMAMKHGTVFDPGKKAAKEGYKLPTFSVGDVDVDSSLSANGRYVAFSSNNDNLVEGDTNGTYDVFVYDLRDNAMIRVSVSSEGIQGNGESVSPKIKGNGRFVVFESEAANLDHSDCNDNVDVFRHDVKTGETSLVSCNGDGEPGNDDSGCPSITPDGKFVSFTSRATNLVPNDTNNLKDVFVKNMETGAVERVSVAGDGSQAMAFDAMNASDDTSISSDGRFVVFSSAAYNLVENDDNNMVDVFLHDRQTGNTTRVSVGSKGEEGNSYSHSPVISGNGEYVTYDACASNLVPGDTNKTFDIFLYEVKTGKTTLISRSSGGVISNGESQCPVIDETGKHIAYSSLATNLTPEREGILNIYVYDRIDGKTYLASRVPSELKHIKTIADARKYLGNPGISGDGSSVTYYFSAHHPLKRNKKHYFGIMVSEYSDNDITVVPNPKLK